MIRLETERLILRPWEDRDRAPLARIMGDPRVRRFYPGVLTPQQSDAQMHDARAKAAAFGVHLQAAELKADGALVGMLGIGYVPDDARAAIPGLPEIEIGWVLAERFWGQGLAPEGARAWLDYGWHAMNLEEIVAFTAAVNLPSRRVMEKIGMSRDPADDFEHPRVAIGHRLRPHVLYRIAKPAAL